MKKQRLTSRAAIIPDTPFSPHTEIIDAVDLVAGLDRFLTENFRAAYRFHVTEPLTGELHISPEKMARLLILIFRLPFGRAPLTIESFSRRDVFCLSASFPDSIEIDEAAQNKLLAFADKCGIALRAEDQSGMITITLSAELYTRAASVSALSVPTFYSILFSAMNSSSSSETPEKP